LSPPSSNGGAPKPGAPAAAGDPAAVEERILAVRALDAPDILTRLSVLVARRGATLSSALTVREAGLGRRTVAVVVAGAPRVVSRLPLWIANLPDVLDVRDLTAGAEPEARGEVGPGADAKRSAAGRECP
jgi:hypothetical protein